MRRRIALALIGWICSAIPLLAQRRVDPEDIYERGIFIVPMTGSGTYEDPRRPLLVPRDLSQERGGIVGWTFEPSDDGQLAIVEVQTKDRPTLDKFLSDSFILKKFVRVRNGITQVREWDYDAATGRLNWHKYPEILNEKVFYTYNTDGTVKTKKDAKKCGDGVRVRRV